MNYLAFELRRAARNPRFFLFTVALPVVLFLIYAGMYGNQSVPGSNVTYAAYLMCSMAAYGSFTAAMSTGARTALERSSGWQRQLRLTPLTSTRYLLSKALVSFIVALVPILLVSLIGLAAEHVHLSADRWLLAIVGIWLATIPFTALGLLIGQLATADSLQAYSMSFLLILSLLGGLWIPVTQFPSWLQNLAQMLPSYWLAEIGHSAVGLSVNVPHAIMNLAAWTVVFAFIGARRYQRDALRA